MNLNNPNILSSSQACLLWDIHDSSLRKQVDEFPNGTIRRVGTTWIVTPEGMKFVFGERKIWYPRKELESIIEITKEIINKEKRYHSGNKIHKSGIDFLTNKGYHLVVSQDIVRVITNQMNEKLFFEIYQLNI